MYYSQRCKVTQHTYISIHYVHTVKVIVASHA